MTEHVEANWVVAARGDRTSRLLRVVVHVGRRIHISIQIYSNEFIH